MDERTDLGEIEPIGGSAKPVTGPLPGKQLAPPVVGNRNGLADAPEFFVDCRHRRLPDPDWSNPPAMEYCAPSAIVESLPGGTRSMAG